MPRTPHIERHFTASDSVRDVVIGMSDKAHFTEAAPLRSAFHTMLIGGAAAAVAFAIARAIT